MILIVGATREELSEVISHLDNKKDLITPFPAYQGQINDHDLLVLLTGVGKVNAAAALTYFLTNFKIDLVINLGLVGSAGISRGTLATVKKASYHDYDVTFFGYEVGEIPKMGKWFYSKNLLNNPFIEVDLYTGDKFVSTKLAFAKPYLVDMEGASLFQVAKIFGKEIISLKLVSDDVTSETQDQEFKEAEEISGKYKLYEGLLRLLETNYEK